jgi:Ca-activated chloride channel homolog
MNAMRFPMAFLVAFLFCVVSLPAQQPSVPAPPPPEQSDQTKPIRRNVSLVNVLATVLNNRNRVVFDLKQHDFKIFDDNQPQEIRFFSSQSDLPLRIGLLLDTSNSIRDRLQFEQEAAIDFLYNVIRKGKDQAFIMTVDDVPEIVQPLTGDLDRLRDVILRQRPGGGTALYDGIYDAAQLLSREVPAAAGSELEARGVLVVISDGKDNLSRHSRGHALEMAQHAGVVIYTISSSTEWIKSDQETSSFSVNQKFMKGEGDKILEEFAIDSGGRAFFPYRVDDLAQSFANIGDELRSQYSLAYVPTGRTPDGKYHKIRVEVATKELKVQARKGYYADVAEALEQSSTPAAPAAP